MTVPDHGCVFCGSRGSRLCRQTNTRAVTTPPGLSFRIAASDDTTQFGNRALASFSMNLSTCPRELWSSGTSSGVFLLPGWFFVVGCCEVVCGVFLVWQPPPPLGQVKGQLPWQPRTRSDSDPLCEVADTHFRVFCCAEELVQEAVVHKKLVSVAFLSVQVAAP